LSTTDARGFRDDGYRALCAAVWETRAFGDFWQHCLVAEGAIDLAVEPAANPWDLAALVPIVREAGGTCTSLAGAATFTGGDALTSNTALHTAALSALAP
ncbi:MAG: histidinol-phosphatase, partial [Pseudonocardia sp.]|nr:histidinol-phosphatase [Pseudonocardia sp.]